MVGKMRNEGPALSEEHSIPMNSSQVTQSTTGKHLARVLLSHPTGNQNLRSALQCLVEQGMLAEFWTTIAWDSDSVWDRLLPSAIVRQLRRRSYGEIPRQQIHCAPSRELVRLAVRGTPLDDLLCSAERPYSVVGMYRHFDKAVAQRLRLIDVDAVYAYEGGALETFRVARRKSIQTLYDLPSGYWYWERNLLQAEIELHPEMASVTPKISDSVRHMQEKDEELQLSDFVVVASRHVRSTLAGVVPEDKIFVVPYGTPPVRERPASARNSTKPLQVLFAGTLTQRKGIGYLIKAMELLGSDAELTLVGHRVAPNEIVDQACNRWKWYPTMPHNELLELMSRSDVLVLPSLTEGFGLVVSEALSCGVPVIITPNVGAGDLITDGSDGYVVPVGSAEAIAAQLARLNADRQLLHSMSQNAHATAAKNDWAMSRNKWMKSVEVALWQQ